MKPTHTLSAITIIALALLLGACSDESKKELKEAGKQTKEAAIAVGKDIKHGAEVAKEKTVEVYHEVKEDASAAAQVVARKSGEYYDTAKQKSGEYYEAAKQKTGEIYEAAKKDAGNFVQDDQYEAPQEDQARDKP